jgi:hypothetical protein
MATEIAFFVVGAMLGAVLWDIYIRFSEYERGGKDDGEQ